MSETDDNQAGRYAVVMVAGSSPPMFYVAFEITGAPRSSLMKTTDFMSEADMRAELQSRGFTQTEIGSLIKKARENPA
jgi:hypothetical protein